MFSGAPKVEGDEFWNASVESNSATIDHDLWQDILDEYLISDDPSGVNLFDYEGLQESRDTLDEYIDTLIDIRPQDYSRAVQQAYWINLYNALTVRTILDEYPVESITKLGKTALSFGPWDDKVIVVAGKELSLNNIEHGILRPFWQDYRVHFAVNCASIGCPNVQPEAFTAVNSEELLDLGAQEYLAHPRGARFEGDTLILSSIFDWYGVDFGNTLPEILSVLAAHAEGDLAERLTTYQGKAKYEYDWDLNSY